MFEYFAIVLIIYILFRKPIKTGLFAAKIASNLLDLGIDVKRLDKASAQVLFEIERDRYKDLNAKEAASHFFCAALQNLDESCFLLKLTHEEMAKRAVTMMSAWVYTGKMNEIRFESNLKCLLREQLIEPQFIETLLIP